MASLPRHRVTIDRPFITSGVDFCGPIAIKSGIRRVASIKAYISVFVCLTTRAVHLEVVSALTTEAFIAALNRFMSRRGFCANLYSDNGTYFTGADAMLRKYFNEAQKQHSVDNYLAEKGVKWHFIPPSAPHFGSIWEAAVKSAKTHLYKVTKAVLLNFEELTTLRCRIEEVLNSRPLIAMSKDPTDYEVLTPGHFLIGSRITTPVEPDVSEIPQNRLRRFELVRSQVKFFWRRWKKEYLPQLQKRTKWFTLQRVMVVGDLAILKDDNLPPLKWKMVRVVETHPGDDGVVRAVSVKTPKGTILKRPVVKLSLLPNSTDEDTEQPE